MPAAATEEQQLVLVSKPLTEADLVLRPDEIRPVIKAPSGHQLEGLREEAVDRPEQQNGPIGGRNLDRLQLLERHRRVVVLGRARGVGAAELPGRIGVDEVEAPVRYCWCGADLGVACLTFE